ncbi:hypothetical protein Tco_0468291 [Tanacetum coccineum]
MDGNRPKKQKFIPFKLKNTKGVSTSNNTSISNVFEVLGDLEDDGHLDAHNTEKIWFTNARKNKKASRVRRIVTPVFNTSSTLREDKEKCIDDLVDDTIKKVGAPHRKNGIWLGRNADSSSESGFTSQNHFDLLTKENAKNILLNR